MTITSSPWLHPRCPACRRRALFLAEGGYVTCGSLDCPNPDAVNQMLEAATAEPARQDGHTAPSDAASDPDGESHPEPASEREAGAQPPDSMRCAHCHQPITGNHTLHPATSTEPARRWHPHCAPNNPDSPVSRATREQLHHAIRELARTDPDWWHQQIRRMARIDGYATPPKDYRP